MIKPYKNREINIDKPVKIYRCLNRKGKVYSIKQGSLVVGHTENITLSDVKFIVNESGKKRAIKTGERNVHAYIEGYITSDNVDNRFINKITYYPFNNHNFLIESTNKEINESSFVHIDNNGVFAKI